jgi:DNA mismatch repair protein MutS
MFAALIKTLSLGKTILSGCKLVGTIDAYLSMAALHDEHQDKPVTFSFANFTDDAKKPELTLKNFWHPALDPATAVPNSIAMGGPHRMKDMILTGPNTGGKSSVLKGASLCILLGQTFGIAPAEKATMTPFAHLNTYANLTDNLAEGVSLFQAEMNRARELLDNVASLGHKKFSFTVLDEVFTGTEPIPGEAAAYSVGYELAHSPQSMTMIATHFPGIPLLEKATDGIIKNKRVYVIEHDDGTIERPFTLVDGVNTQQIALELMMQHDFFPDLIKEAHRVIAHPEEYRSKG